MGQSERLGTRLRDARLALGLTQTQAAEGIITGAFLSLIESGQRTPSPKVAEALAARLRVSLDAEDAPPDAMTAAAVGVEVALRLGDWETAQAHLSALPQESPEYWMYAGLIAEQRAQFPEALHFLGLAAASPAAATGLSLRAKLYLCRCARSAGDLMRSIEVGERALADIHANPHADRDVEAELRATLAGTYCETGDLFRARELTELQDHNKQDPWSMATQRWSRAMVLQTSGDFAEARGLAFEALGILRTMDRPRSEAQLQNTAAWIAMQTPLFEVAEIDRMLRDSERVFRQTHSPMDLSLALSSRAELAIRCGDRVTALHCIEEALVLADGEDTGHRARITASAAQIYAATGDRNESMRRLLLARDLLEGSGAKRAAAETWRQMAQTYEELGELDLTVECLKAATELMGLQPMLQTRIAETLDVVEFSTANLNEFDATS